MLSPNLIWSETRWRMVLDGGVCVGFLLEAMAAGVLRVRATEGGEGGAESLPEDDVVRMMPLAGMGRLCTGGSTGGQTAAEERGSPALRSGGSGGEN
jgi:hypothetical protein